MFYIKESAILQGVMCMIGNNKSEKMLLIINNLEDATRSTIKVEVVYTRNLTIHFTCT